MADREAEGLRALRALPFQRRLALYRSVKPLWAERNWSPGGRRLIRRFHLSRLVPVADGGPVRG